jgi:hypothetical protein
MLFNFWSCELHLWPFGDVLRQISSSVTGKFPGANNAAGSPLGARPCARSYLQQAETPEPVAHCISKRYVNASRRFFNGTR